MKVNKENLTTTMYELSDEWNDKKGFVTLEFSLSENDVPLFLQLSKQMNLLYGGEWVCLDCETCREYNPNKYIHCIIETNKFGSLDRIKAQSKYYK